MKFVLFICLYLLKESFAVSKHYSTIEKADDTLLLAQVIFRHGDRTPVADFPKNPHKGFNYGVQGLGQLTPIGIQQGYLLGCYLRKRYDGFLNLTYSKEEVYVQSSDSDRTIITAMSSLSCLFPSTLSNTNEVYSNLPNQKINHQFVPVHVLTKGSDDKLASFKNCPKHRHLFQEALKSPKILSLYEENKEMCQIIAKETGVTVNGIFDILIVYDALNVNTIYNLSLPAWTKGIFPEKLPDVASRLHGLWSETEEMKRLYTRKLLEQMIQNMDIVSGQKSKGGHPVSKMYLYSGHDLTLTSLMDVLGIYNETMTLKPPQYTAAILLEFHKSMKPTNPEPVVKMFLRPGISDRTLELLLPKCGNPCSLSMFKKTYEKYWTNTPSWETECSLLSSKGSTNQPFSLLLFLSLLGFLAKILKFV